LRNIKTSENVGPVPTGHAAVRLAMRTDLPHCATINSDHFWIEN